MSAAEPARNPTAAPGAVAAPASPAVATTQVSAASPDAASQPGATVAKPPAKRLPKRRAGRGGRADTRTLLRRYGALTLMTCTLTGVTGLAITQTDSVTSATSMAYGEALYSATAAAADVERMSTQALTSTATDRVETVNTAVGNLAAQIPGIADVAPDRANAQLGNISRSISEYSAQAATALTVRSATDLSAANANFEGRVIRQLEYLQSTRNTATAGFFLPVTLFAVTALGAVWALLRGAYVLATRTRRVFSLPLTAGIVLLGGVVALGVAVATGSLVVPLGFTGAGVLVGGIGAGLAAWSGFAQRLGDYE